MMTSKILKFEFIKKTNSNYFKNQILFFLQVNSSVYPFKPQYHKMVKHTQTIRWQIANELFERV